MNDPTLELISRRNQTIGPFSPLFYREPLHLVSAEGVWMTDVHGERYLDAYNNVPHVGHANERVIAALDEQASRLNVHTRYLNDRIVDYSERLLATFPPELDRVYFGNSGSEANELALRIARQVTGAKGVIVSDYSYHGTTITIAGLTTGMSTGEEFAPNARVLRIPDLLTDHRSENEVVAEALAELDSAIASLDAAGFGLAACLFDPLFSTEGLPSVPSGLMAGIVERVHAAGGLVIADEVQSGFGRVGTHMWGHQRIGMRPDLVTMGKPMGNGHPMSAVVTSAVLQNAFGSANRYFNTFAGNPVSAAVGMAVLEEMDERRLMAQAQRVSELALDRLRVLKERYDFIGATRGAGMFLGLEFTHKGESRPDLAMQVVEAMKDRRVLISKTGRSGNVLKIRPPLVFGPDELSVLLDALEQSIEQVAADRG